MKLTFYSNFLNHHQLPFCLYMNKILGDGFRFVACSPIGQERLSMGYEDMNSKYDFVIREYHDEKSKKEAIRLSEESDVIIIGSAPIRYLEKRALDGKLSFIYSERLLKKGTYRRFIPVTRCKVYNNFIRFKNTNTHILCASSYTAYDLSLFGMQGNTYKWGYFPEVKNYDIDILMKSKHKEVVKILWCGRLLSLKHPEAAIQVAKKLKSKEIPFTLDIIGNGKMASYIQKLINKNNLEKEISILGAMSPEQVRSHMEFADIFLFTSDFNEGWGAVLNEAMNSGCAVVASHAIGSVPFLIKHRKNGFIYQNNDINDLYNCVEKLATEKDLCYNLGKSAYETMINQWNAKIAAERLLVIAEGLSNGDNFDSFSDGPCSRANIIKNNWIKGRDV